MASPDARTSFARVADAGITGYAADDGAALHFTGNQFAQALSSGESSSAYLFRPMNGGVEERALPVTYLGTQRAAAGVKIGVW